MALLAVTVSQLGHYLSQFAPPETPWVGYLQAIGIDATIWRCAHWYRVYQGSKQKRQALAGLLFFLGLSAWFNTAYYLSLENAPGMVTAIAMGIALPLSVAAVSYLQGVKETSAFGRDGKKRSGKEENPSESLEGLPAIPEVAPAVPTVPSGALTCESCGRSFGYPSPYRSQRAAQNALNAHQCPRSNGSGSARELVAILSNPIEDGTSD